MVLVNDLHPEVIKVCRPLILEDEVLKLCANIFHDSLAKGLSIEEKEKSPIKCSLTHVEDFPLGTEFGNAIGFGFSGKSLRIVYTSFKGSRDCVTSSKWYEIPEQKIADRNGPKVIEYLAKCVANFIQTTRIRDGKIILGLAYGLPMEKECLQDAKMIGWPDEFQFNDLSDKDFFSLFKLALKKFEATKNIYLISLVSDTAACLLSGLYRDPSTRISIAVGDSLNLSYIEKYKNTTAFSGDGLHSRTALDAEIKNFGDDGCLDFIKTEFDYLIDSRSSNPGQCTFEKLISGFYLGELVRLNLVQLVDAGIILSGYSSEKLNTKGSIRTEDVAVIEKDNEKNFSNCKKFLQKLGYSKVEDSDCLQIRFVCRCFAKRSSNLIAACVAALLIRLQSKNVNVMADGFLIKEFPSYQNYFLKRLSLMKRPEVRFGLTIADKEDVGIGAGLLALIYRDGVIRMEDKYRALPSVKFSTSQYNSTGMSRENCNCETAGKCEKKCAESHSSSHYNLPCSTSKKLVEPVESSFS